MKKIYYYGLSHDLIYENSLLKQWGIQDIELASLTGGGKNWAEACWDGDGLIVKGTYIGKEELSFMPRLKAVGVESIGYDNLDRDAFQEKGVPVVNTPGFCAEDVALHTAGLLLDLVRHITYYNRKLLKEGFHCQKDVLPERLFGKQVCLMGFGSIPQKLTPILKAMGLSVSVWGTRKSEKELQAFGVNREESLEELLKKADILSLHLPLTGKTKGLMGERELRLMKPTALLINTARGGLIQEEVLIQALREGWIAGAAVDVIEHEKEGESGLFSMENVIATPHIAFLSEESGYEARKQVLAGVIKELEVFLNCNIK